MSENSVKTVERIPMMWAVGITVMISLPFGSFLGTYNFSLWISFIVWAEYFVLGATPATAKLIFPSIPFGAAKGVGWCICAAVVEGFLPVWMQEQNFWGMFLTTPIWLPGLIFTMNKWKPWVEGTLATFNGFSLFLGVYGTGCYPQVGPLDNIYWVIILSWLWTVAMCYFGWVLGWLNVTLTFPKKVPADQKEEDQQSS